MNSILDLITLTEKYIKHEGILDNNKKNRSEKRGHKLNFLD